MKKKCIQIIANPILIWTLVMLCVCAMAKAEEGGHGATEVHEAGIPKIVYYQALNFFGLLGILYFVMKKKIGGYFVARHKTLTSALTEAKRLRDEAQKKHQDYTVKIQNLEKEAVQMLEQIRREGEELRRKLIQEAQRIAESIEREAKRTAENEIERARAELYDDVLEQALEGARKLLVKSVVDNDQRRLQKEFVEKIEAVQ